MQMSSAATSREKGLPRLYKNILCGDFTRQILAANSRQNVPAVTSPQSIPAATSRHRFLPRPSGELYKHPCRHFAAKQPCRDFEKERAAYVAYCSQLLEFTNELNRTYRTVGWPAALLWLIGKTAAGTGVLVVTNQIICKFTIVWS